MDMQTKIKAGAQRDALEYRDIIGYLAERFTETTEQATERMEIIAELVRETPKSAGVAAEFLGLSGQQMNLCLEVLGVLSPAWIDEIVEDEVRVFDAAGEAIRSAVIATSAAKGYNIAAARHALNKALEDVADGRKSLADATATLGVTEDVLAAYRDA